MISKRVFDILGSAFLLFLLSPLLLLISLLILIQLGRPVLYRQKRPGRWENPFFIYKFRTMLDLKDQDGKPLPDEQRLSRFGRFLRSTSLDELPELWNVLLGQMSLVGPRPLLMQYLNRYTREQKRRHEVKPGITGWAQIHGRNTLTWEDRFRMDVWYVDHRTFLLDLKILLITVWKILIREGISAEGYATMPEFTGSTGSSISKS